jgi:hypothetical protein
MILTLEQAKRKPSLRFPKGNKIGFWMDFQYWECIPSDRDFYIAGEAPHDSLDLVAEGYGLEGSYGNGSIFVARKDVFCLRIPDDLPAVSRASHYS